MVLWLKNLEIFQPEGTLKDDKPVQYGALKLPSIDKCDEKAKFESIEQDCQSLIDGIPPE